LADNKVRKGGDASILLATKLTSAVSVLRNHSSQAVVGEFCDRAVPHQSVRLLQSQRSTRHGVFWIKLQRFSAASKATKYGVAFQRIFHRFNPGATATVICQVVMANAGGDD